MITKILNDEVRHGDVILLTKEEQEYLNCSPWQFVLSVDDNWWRHVFIETIKGTIKRNQHFRSKNKKPYHYSTVDRLDPEETLHAIWNEMEKQTEISLERYFAMIEKYKNGGLIKGDIIVPHNE